MTSPAPEPGAASAEGHTPQRQCAACRRRAPARRLLRLAVGPRQELVVDVYRRLPGRGVHLCANPSCLRTALAKGSLGRALREPVRGQLEGLALQASDALRERAAQALGMGRRGGLVRYGADEVRRALASGETHLVWLAVDASERTSGEFQESARLRGIPVVVALPMTALGGILGRGDVGVVAVVAAGLAADVAWWMDAAVTLGAAAPKPAPGPGLQAPPGTVESIDGGA